MCYDVVRKPYVWYVGGTFGGYGARTNVSSVETPLGPAFAGVAAAENPFTSPIASGTLHDRGLTISGFGGFNRRVGNYLFGIEADANYIGSHQRLAKSSPSLTGIDSFTSIRITHLETLRARLGYQHEPTLYFATAGLAGAEYSAQQNINFALGAETVGERSFRYRGGWVIGAGVEHDLSAGVKLRAEYLYVDLGRVSRSLETTCPQTAGTGAPACIVPAGFGVYFPTNYDLSLQIARVGLVVELDRKPGTRSVGLKDDAADGYIASATDPAQRWTGLYFTPSASAVTGKTRFTVANKPQTGQAITDFAIFGGNSFFPAGTANDVKISGLAVGAVLGYQKQFSRLVLGADVGAATGSVGGQADCNPANGTGAGLFGAGYANVTAKCTSRYEYSAALRGRIGYADGNKLYYVNAGPALAKINNSVDFGGTFTNPAFAGGTPQSMSYFNEKGTNFTLGWTAGIGFEYEMPNGMIFGLAYNRTVFNTTAIDMRRADGTTNRVLNVKADPDVIGSSLKIKLGDTTAPAAQALPAPAQQNVAATTATPAAAPRPPVAVPAPRPVAAPAPIAPRPAPPAARPVLPGDGTPMEPGEPTDKKGSVKK